MFIGSFFFFGCRVQATKSGDDKDVSFSLIILAERERDPRSSGWI
jgi:hypothetical protein